MELLHLPRVGIDDKKNLSQELRAHAPDSHAQVSPENIEKAKLFIESMIGLIYKQSEALNAINYRSDELTILRLEVWDVINFSDYAAVHNEEVEQYWTANTREVMLMCAQQLNWTVPLALEVETTEEQAANGERPTASDGGPLDGQQLPASDGGPLDGQQLPASDNGSLDGQQLPASDGSLANGQQASTSDGKLADGQQQQPSMEVIEIQSRTPSPIGQDLVMTDAESSLDEKLAALLQDLNLHHDPTPLNGKYASDIATTPPNGTLPYSEIFVARMGPLRGRIDTAAIMDWLPTASNEEKAVWTLAMEHQLHSTITEASRRFAEAALQRIHGDNWRSTEATYSVRRETFISSAVATAGRQLTMSVAMFLTGSHILGGESALRTAARTIRMSQIWSSTNASSQVRAGWDSRAYTTLAKGQDLLNQLAPSDKQPAHRKVFVTYMSKNYPVLAQDRQVYKEFDEAWSAFVSDCQQNRPVDTYTSTSLAIAMDIKKKLDFDFFHDVIMPIIHQEWSKDIDKKVLWASVKPTLAIKDRISKKPQSDDSTTDDEQTHRGRAKAPKATTSSDKRKSSDMATGSRKKSDAVIPSRSSSNSDDSSDSDDSSSRAADQQSGPSDIDDSENIERILEHVSTIQIPALEPNLARKARDRDLEMEDCSAAFLISVWPYWCSDPLQLAIVQLRTFRQAVNRLYAVTLSESLDSLKHRRDDMLPTINKVLNTVIARRIKDQQNSGGNV